MKVCFGIGFTVRLALLCLVAGIALGLYLGVTATGRTGRTDGVAVTDSRHPHRRAPCPGKEVTTWSRTRPSSCSAGS